MNPLLHAAGGARFLTIDGLRGIAAMAVVVYHYGQAVGLSNDRLMTTWWNWCANGVEIFFVLSGFVIAHSVRTAWFSGTFFWRFAFRRLIRLDPPYWITILLEVTLLWVSLQIFSDLQASMPTLTQFLTHFFYLQALTGHPQMLAVFWSLCLEFQFYIALVGGMTIITTLTRRNDALTKQIVLVAGGALFGWSLLVHGTFLPNPWPGLFVERWYQFACGTIAWAFVMGHISIRLLLLAVGAAWCVSLSSIWTFGPAIKWHASSMLMVSTLALAMGLWGRYRDLSTLLSGAVMQFLGRISYSLFLIHLVIGARAIGVFDRMLPGTALAKWSMFFAGLAIAVFTAWIMYLFLEKPALQLAQRVSLPRRESGPDGVGGPAATRAVSG